MFSKKKEARSEAHVPDWKKIVAQRVRIGNETKSAKKRRFRNFFRASLMGIVAAAVLALMVFVWTKTTGTEAENEMTPLVIKLKTDGFLDEAWLRAWANVPAGTREVGIVALRKKLETYGQIKQAEIVRGRGNSLQITLKERAGVARVQLGNRVEIVASDGILFPAETFVSAQNRLPFITGATVVAGANGRESLQNIDVLLKFLAAVRRDYSHFLLEWESISIKDLPARILDADTPWAVLRVKPLAEAQNPGFPRLREIVFSAQHFEKELALLGSPDAQAKIEQRFAEENRDKLYDIVFLTNRKHAHRTFQEMHIIPISNAQERP